MHWLVFDVSGVDFRSTRAGAVPGAGTADVGHRLRLLPRSRRGPVGAVRLRVLVPPTHHSERGAIVLLLYAHLRTNKSWFSLVQA